MHRPLLISCWHTLSDYVTHLCHDTREILCKNEKLLESTQNYEEPQPTKKCQRYVQGHEREGEIICLTLVGCRFITFSFSYVVLLNKQFTIPILMFTKSDM